jgi:hypothetical protein
MTKPKYRIIKRQDGYYYAQEKTLFWWSDLPTESFSSHNIGIPMCETPSHSLKFVENYMDYVALKRYQQDIHYTVVKTYYE